MVTTITNPQFIYSLNQIHEYHHLGTVGRLCNRILHDCDRVKKYYRSGLAKEAVVDMKIIDMADVLYLLVDDVILACPIKEKINTWMQAYCIAYHQQTQLPSYRISVGKCRISLAETTTEDLLLIRDLLIEKSEEFSAWVELYEMKDQFSERIAEQLLTLSDLLSKQGYHV